MTGDWDGDQVTGVGVRRRRGRAFFLRKTAPAPRVKIGRITDLPVTGDWDGSGTTDVGVWRPGAHAFRLLRRRHAAGGAAHRRRSAPLLTGDWDGDGVTDLGVFDAATATFTLRTVAGGTASTSTVALGTATDLPVTGDWNGDGVTDLGVWTPATATYTLRTTPAPGLRRARVPPSSSASRADLACPLDTGCRARGSTALEAFGGHAPALPARRHDEDGHDLPAERLAGQPRGLADQGVYYPVAPGSPAQRFAVWDFLGRHRQRATTRRRRQWAALTAAVSGGRTGPCCSPRSRWPRCRYAAPPRRRRLPRPRGARRGHRPTSAGSCPRRGRRT